MAEAVAQASSYSSDLTPSLGTSICLRCGPKKKKRCNIGHHVCNTGRNIDGKGHSYNVSVSQTEMKTMETGGKLILVVKWQRTWLNYATVGCFVKGRAVKA